MNDFWKLDLNDRAEILWTHAELLSTRREGAQKVSLYMLNGHFIELWYDGKKNEVTKIETISENERFNLYANEVDLSKLIW